MRGFLALARFARSMIRASSISSIVSRIWRSKAFAWTSCFLSFAQLLVGGVFIIVAYFPVAGWDKVIAPYLQLLQVPVTATFGLLAVFVCFAIGYDLGKRLRQEAIVSAAMATVVFLMLQIQLKDQSVST